MPDLTPARVTLSVTRKVNLGDYESTEIFMSVGVDAESTPEEIQTAVQTGEVLFNAVASSVKAQADRLRTGMR